MLSIILDNKDIEKYGQNFKYNKKYPLQKKYFLICGGCFWMASTLPPYLDYPLIRYKKCPICKNNVHNFQIPNQYRQVMSYYKICFSNRNNDLKSPKSMADIEYILLYL